MRRWCNLILICVRDLIAGGSRAQRLPAHDDIGVRKHQAEDAPLRAGITSLMGAKQQHRALMLDPRGWGGLGGVGAGGNVRPHTDAGYSQGVCSVNTVKMVQDIEL